MDETAFWTAGMDALASVGGLVLVVPRSAVSVIRGLRPLDVQFGCSPKKSVPDALYPWIFDPLASSSGASADQHLPGSFALLDASRAPGVPDLLENGDLEWCSLFSGQAAADLRSVAPYLVRLKQDSRVTRRLFSASGMADDLWDAAPGVYLRSDLGLAGLRRQFRKFTRIRLEDGTWCYFRFWEISALEHATSEAGSDLFSRLWGDCRVIWRDDDGDQAIFYLR